ALDPAGKYVPGVNIFEPLTFGNVSLTAGFFTGSSTNTTGIGLFVDLSNVINQAPTTVAHDVGRFLVGGRSGLSTSKPANRLILKKVTPASRDQMRLFKKLYEMSNQGITLRLDE